MSAKLLSVLLLADITSRRYQFIVCLRASVLHKYLQCRAGRRSMRSIGNWWSLKAREACNSACRNWSVWGLANFGISSHEKNHIVECALVCVLCAPRLCRLDTDWCVCIEPVHCHNFTIWSVQTGCNYVSYQPWAVHLENLYSLLWMKVLKTFSGGWVLFWNPGLKVWNSYMQPACLACVCIKNALFLQEPVIAYNLLARPYLFLTGYVLQVWNRFLSRPIAVLKYFQLKNLFVSGIIITSVIISSAFSVKV